MECSSAKYIGIHDGTAKLSIKAADEVLGTLEHWCKWDSIISRETIDGVHEIRAVILHNILIFPIRALNFTR